MKRGFLECYIDGTNIIIGNTIIGKIPPIGSDKYDYIIGDHFFEIDENKKYVIEEYKDTDFTDFNFKLQNYDG